MHNALLCNVAKLTETLSHCLVLTPLAHEQRRHHDHKCGNAERDKLLLKALVVARAEMVIGALTAHARAKRVEAHGALGAPAILVSALVNIGASVRAVDLVPGRALALRACRIHRLIACAAQRALGAVCAAPSTAAHAHGALVVDVAVGG